MHPGHWLKKGTGGNRLFGSARTSVADAKQLGSGCLEIGDGDPVDSGGQIDRATQLTGVVDAIVIHHEASVYPNLAAFIGMTGERPVPRVGNTQVAIEGESIVVFAEAGGGIESSRHSCSPRRQTGKVRKDRPGTFIVAVAQSGNFARRVDIPGKGFRITGTTCKGTCDRNGLLRKGGRSARDQTGRSIE